MAVTVTQTSARTAEITWTADDDPQGYLARSVSTDQLAYALEALGDGESATATPETALSAAMHTATLGRLLERRAAVQVVRLRDDHGLSWRQIASALYDDPDRQSSVRRMYDSGRRHIGY
jgi:DNA-binding NarL/FixJ family response regulator